MARAGGESTGAGLAEARENASWVLAEAALEGERVVSWVRVALVVLIVLSQSIVARLTGERLPPDLWRGAAVTLYLLFVVSAVLVLRREEPSPKRAVWLPVLTTLVDFGFFWIMAWRAAELGRFNPALAVGTGAVVLGFSALRYSRLHVVLATAMACVSFASYTAWVGRFSLGTASFVCGCFIALGLMLVRVNMSVSTMFLGLRRRDNLSRFLPREVVERVLKDGGKALEPVQREVTILFSDIRDFTTLSERLQPQEVLKLLEEYFGHMARIVMAHGGMVNKFLGDGMLACWGALDSREQHAVEAMRAALDMRVKLVEINEARARRGEEPLRIGIGLHTGLVAAGMLSGAEQYEYTVIGDAVNLASRVEGLTKALGVDILVSESTWRQSRELFSGRRLSEEKVKGRKEAVVVYSLEGYAPQGGAREQPVLSATA